jgi:hypothetical protein
MATINGQAHSDAVVLLAAFGNAVEEDGFGDALLLGLTNRTVRAGPPRLSIPMWIAIAVVARRGPPTWFPAGRSLNRQAETIPLVVSRDRDERGDYSLHRLRGSLADLGVVAVLVGWKRAGTVRNENLRPGSASVTSQFLDHRARPLRLWPRKRAPTAPGASRGSHLHDRHSTLRCPALETSEIRA